MDLHTTIKKTRDYIKRIALPGTEALLLENESARSFLSKQEQRLQLAIEDANGALVDEACGSLVKAQERMNRLIAEDFRLKNPNVDDWTLGLFQWMSIRYIHFGSPYGDFFVYPQLPRYIPKANVAWFTAEELMNMVATPSIGEAIRLFGVMPTRPESCRTMPPEGETDFDVYLEEVPMIVKARRGQAQRGGYRRRG